MYSLLINNVWKTFIYIYNYVHNVSFTVMYHHAYEICTWFIIFVIKNSDMHKMKKKTFNGIEFVVKTFN